MNADEAVVALVGVFESLGAASLRARRPLSP